MTSLVLFHQIQVYHTIRQAQMAAETIPEALRCLLDSDDVHFKHKTLTLEKIARFIEAGAGQLSVISDFDHTLTPAIGDDGNPCAVTHQVFGDALKLPDITQK
ncbi:hypothetical protein PFISCL1PPCAC_9831, partial [Pristionchus fissidentatus]